MENEVLDRVLEYLYKLIPGFIAKSQIIREVFNNDKSVPIDAILLFLKEEGLIFNELAIVNNTALPKTNRYSLTMGGILFFQNAGILNRPYCAHELENIQEAEKSTINAKLAKREAFPKQNWMILPIITFVRGGISTIEGEYLKRKIWPEAKAASQIVIIRDTVRLAPVAPKKP